MAYFYVFDCTVPLYLTKVSHGPAAILKQAMQKWAFSEMVVSNR